MRISTIGYTLKQGIKNIWRNKWFSLASIATMTACIFLFSLFFAIVTNFNHMVKTAEEGVGIVVFFNEGLEQSAIDKIGEKIKSHSSVKEIKFVSAEEALENFMGDYLEGHEELAEGFLEDNPLADSVNYEVYVKDIEAQDELVEYIRSIDGVRSVEQSEAAVNMMSTFNVLVGYVSVAVIGILLAVSVFLISNTVAVGISVRSEEIAIMKLIGAKDSFVRAPFLIEGILIGFVGAAIPVVLFYFGYREVVGYVLERFTMLNGILQFIAAREIFAVLVPVALVLGMGIGLLGSAATVRKHLHV